MPSALRERFEFRRTLNVKVEEAHPPAEFRRERIGPMLGLERSGLVDGIRSRVIGLFAQQLGFVQLIAKPVLPRENFVQIPLNTPGFGAGIGETELVSTNASADVGCAPAHDGGIELPSR